jgi:hypothetical protein
LASTGSIIFNVVIVGVCFPDSMRESVSWHVLAGVAKSCRFKPAALRLVDDSTGDTFA